MKSKPWYHLIPVRIVTIKKTRGKCWQGWGERRPLCTIDGNVNWCSHYGKEYGVSSKFKIELPYDPAISLLGMYPKEMETYYQRDICTPMFMLHYSQ